MIVNCLIDGVAFEATRPQAKYCSARCRKRAQRGSFGQTPPVEMTSRSKKASSASSSATPGGNSGAPVDPAEKPFIRATREELEAAGVLDSVIGQHVLLIAQQMCGRETAGGMTTLSKEFSRMRAEALRSAVSAVIDPVDELRARREAKAAG